MVNHFLKGDHSVADKHAYVQSAGHIVQVVNHLRKSFPSIVNAGTLKKLGFAPNNESYVVNTLRFLGLIDLEDKKTELAGEVFSLHPDDRFQPAFGEKVVKTAYKELFALHGEAAWTLGADALITFFRSSDQSGANVGRRQANTFSALSGLSGHSDLAPVKVPGAKRKEKEKKMSKADIGTKVREEKGATEATKTSPVSSMNSNLPVGLTVRIEVNLPATGDQDTYDRIFRSIRENLLNR
jgi:hypothetical protein